MPNSQLSNRQVIQAGLPLFIAAINMRAGLTIMGPLYPILKLQYHLSAFQLSFLTSLTVVCFAGSAVLMPLVAKIGGTNRVITVMLSALSFAMLLRTVGNLALLFISAAAIGVAIAVLNFTLPVWVKENTPGHSGLMTGIYTTVMGTFGSLAIAFAVPLAGLTAWGWRFSMVPWLAISVISSLWWISRVRLVKETSKMQALPKFHRRVFRKGGAWSIAFYFGLQCLVYYGSASWLPTILVTKGFTLRDAGLVVAITGIIGSAIGILTPHYISKSKYLRSILIILGLVIAACFFAVIVGTGVWLIVWLAIANICLSTTFSMSLLLSVLRSADSSETRSLSIMSQSMGYVMAAFAPGLVGGIFDITSSWNSALLVPVIAALLLGATGFFAGKSEKIRIG